MVEILLVEEKQQAMIAYRVKVNRGESSVLLASLLLSILVGCARQDSSTDKPMTALESSCSHLLFRGWWPCTDRIPGASMFLVAGWHGQIAVVEIDDSLSPKTQSRYDLKAEVSAAAVLPDGQRFVVLCADHSFRVCHIGDGSEISRIEIPVEYRDQYDIAESNERHLLCGGGSGLLLCDVETLMFRECLEEGGGLAAVRTSEDGEVAVCGYRDGTIKIRDLSKPESIRVIGKHPGGVNSLDISRDGHVALSGGNNGAVSLWNISTGVLVSSSTSESEPIRAVSLDDQGGRALSSGQDGELVLWDVNQMMGMARSSPMRERIRDIHLLEGGKQALTVHDGWSWSGKKTLVRLWRLPD